MSECTIRGCRTLETKCKDCGRLVNEAIFPLPTNEWVSIKDKTPKDIYPYHEPCPEVLVSYPWGIKIGHQFQCGEWVDDHLHTIDTVSHWMPLPEAPK